MQNLTLHSQLCILKLPNSLLKVSQRRIDFLCSWGEKCWWKSPFWFALCKDVLSSTCLQVDFFFFDRGSNTPKRSLPCTQGVQQRTALAKRLIWKMQKGSACIAWFYSGSAWTGKLPERTAGRTAQPKRQPLSGRPGMKSRVPPSGAPSRCFPPPRAVEGDVGMPFGSKFDWAGLCHLINSMFETKPAFKCTGINTQE